MKPALFFNISVQVIKQDINIIYFINLETIFVEFC